MLDIIVPCWARAWCWILLSPVGHVPGVRYYCPLLGTCLVLDIIVPCWARAWCWILLSPVGHVPGVRYYCPLLGTCLVLDNVVPCWARARCWTILSHVGQVPGVGRYCPVLGRCLFLTFRRRLPVRGSGSCRDFSISYGHWPIPPWYSTLSCPSWPYPSTSAVVVL